MSQDNQHPNINTGEIPQGPRADRGPSDAHAQNDSAKEKEIAWSNAKRDARPKPFERIEFVTHFGVSHIGKPIVMHSKGKFSNYGGEVMLFQSGSNEKPEFYTIDQVEKWRPTNLRTEPREFIGCGDGDHQGLMLPIFVNYLYLRMRERFADEPSPQLRITETRHYLNELELDEYVNVINGRYGHFNLTEIDNEPKVKVEFIDPSGGAGFTRQYDFKQVAQFAEDVYQFWIGVEGDKP